MRINLKRLTDAVPELLELEFIAEDNGILISTTLTIEQGTDLHECLTKALIAAREDKFKTLSGASGRDQNRNSQPIKAMK